ncbi:FecR family protein [Terrimonas alba]|uniref:FecR family protein n=1 Tax=Terrimonas alba TaxID=3349636 RepID=UPI0035F392DD
MKGHIYTIEELMLDESFVNYCLSRGSNVPSQWRVIIRDNPDQQETFEEAKKLVLALHGGLSRPEVNRQIEEVRRQLLGRKPEDATLSDVQEPPLSSTLVVTGKGEIRRKILKSVVLYATAACFLFIAGWFGFKQFNSPGESKHSQPISYQTPLGHRQTITLPDGSTVVLNSNSSISLNANFNENNREIFLNGNALFKVAKNAGKPFIVIANNIATTALGTEFYVHGKQAIYGNIQVDLLEGNVKVAGIGKNAPGDEILLFPGESCKKTAQTKLQKTVFDSTYLRRWESNRISFNETPVLKAFKQLETWFGVSIKVKKEGLKDRAINGEYQSKSLQDILKVICFSINANYSFADNNVIIE